MSTNLRKRVDKLERKLIDLADEMQGQLCNCSKMTAAVPWAPDDFEAEMNRVCPVHKESNLGLLIHVITQGFRPPDAEESAKTAKLERLVEEYEARRRPKALLLDPLRKIGLELRNEAERS